MSSSLDLTNVLLDTVAQQAAAANDPALTQSVGSGLKYIGAALSMLGALGVGASQGYAAASAAQAVGRNPDAQPKILNTMIVGMAITEAVAIYSLIVAILIIFVA